MAFTLHVTAGPSTGSIVADVRRQPRLSVAVSHSRGYLAGRSCDRCLKVSPLTATANHGKNEMVQVEHQKDKEGAGQRFKPGVLHSRRRRGDYPSLFSDAWYPFSAGGIKQMMDMMDGFFPDAAAQGSTLRGIGGRGLRTPWDVAEDEEAFYIRVDLPGFGKDDVKVTVEDGVLIVKGERDSEGKDDDRWATKAFRNFSTRLALPENIELDKIKAELKNGVLNITVPKTKPEDRKQVIDVQVG